MIQGTENVILSSLVFNEQFIRKTIPYIKEEYFSDPCERKIFTYIKDFIDKYNINPTIESLAIILNGDKLADNLYKNSMEIIFSLENNKSDIDWLIDITEKWCQERSIYNAISESISIYEGNNKKHTKHAIPGILSEALSVSFNNKIGHSFFEDSEEQWNYIHSEKARFPFNIEILNRVTKGGIPANVGTLNIFMLPINGGKTLCLIDQAAHWLRSGKNVIYFSMEIAENEIRDRIDTCIMDLNFDQLHSLEKQQYLNRVNKIRQITNGELYIQNFPTGAAHVGHFRHILNEAKIKKSFVPDVIIIDYLTICASSKLRSEMKGNTNTYYTSVAEEIRALGIEYNIPVLTALQYGRSGQACDFDDVDFTNVGLAIGIAAIADFMIAGMIPEELIKEDKSIWKTLKNRYSNKNKLLKFMMGISYDKQQLFDLDLNEQSYVMSEEDMVRLVNQSTPKPCDSSSLSEWKFV